jgi:hypothetical protein
MPSGSGCSGVCCDLTSPGLHINDNDGEFRGNHTKSVFFFKFLDLEAPQPQCTALAMIMPDLILSTVVDIHVTDMTYFLPMIDHFN